VPLLQTSRVGYDGSTVQMSDWSVREIDTGDRYFVGFNMAAGEACISSRIVGFFPSEFAAVTESGRRFELVGNPSANPDADLLWREFLLLSGVTGWKDVTSAFRCGADE
jgi:hypothetical protein